MSVGFPHDAGGPGRERVALLDSLRQRIARGEYRIPAEAVAEAILRAWAGPGPGRAGSAGVPTLGGK